MALKGLVVTLAFLGLVLVALVVGCSPAILACEQVGSLGGAAEIVVSVPAPEPAPPPTEAAPEPVPTKPTPALPPDDAPPH